MRTAGNDDKSPLIDLISCVVCNKTMKLEKSSPDAERGDIIQYRCGVCSRIERVLLFRRSRDLRTEGEVKIENNEGAMISVLIGVLIIVVVGAICFWAIDKFATDSRLANLLKLLVVLVCLGAILQRVLPLTY